MVVDWPTVKVEEIAQKVGMGPFGSSIRVSTFVDDGIPVISGQHLNNARLSDSEYNFVTPEHAEKLKNANVYRGDVIFTHAGNIGQVTYIPETSKYQRYVISQRQFYMRCNRAKVIPEFITYFFKSPQGQYKLLANTSQSGVPSIAQPVSYLRTIEITLPPLPEQRAIAHILGTLDDKIELNRRMNQTLEAMAQALFKSWFVDFEPFRDQGMQDSPLGEIPAGWRVGRLSEFCKTQYGYTASAIEEPVGPHLLRVTDINKQNWIEWDKVPYCEITDGDIAKYRLEVGDLVVARMADPGKSAIIEQPIEAVFASYLVRLKAESLTHAYFLYGFLKSQAYADYSEGAMGGSSVQKSMNAKVIVDVDLIIPPQQALEIFLKRVLPLRKRLVANIEQAATLASIRDTMLPKLLSGEIRIKDAEKFVEEKI